MKNLLVLGIVAVGLAVAMPAMADDFYAVSKLTVSPQTMTDTQLNSVEGQAICVVCGFGNLQVQNAAISQANLARNTNVSFLSAATLQINSSSQGNAASIKQYQR